MIITEQEKRRAVLEAVAEKMMAAARTAPKARGTDNLGIAMVTGEDISRLSAEMEKLGKENDLAFFIRDAACVAASEAVVLIGTANKALGLDCGYCGFPSCENDPAPFVSDSLSSDRTFRTCRLRLAGVDI